MEVISAIGLSFIILSFLLKLPSRTIGIIGLVLIFGHDILQLVPVPANPAAGFITAILFRPSLLPLSQGFSAFTAYPLIPWLGIMLAGFACGEFFELPAEKRTKIFLRLGIASLSLFAILRFINIYGDPSKWAVQKSSLFTFLSFINVTKYPVSLLFTLLFIGITFLVLCFSEKNENRFTGMLSVYGKVSLFYFTIHLYLIHSLMFAMLFLQGFTSNDFLFGAFNNGRPKTGGGVNLATIYIIWIGVVAVMFPLSKWYGKYKSAHRDSVFLRYL
jgi:uncharacterized membrane protein